MLAVAKEILIFRRLTSSFSRSTVLLLFFFVLMTASHLSVLAKAPAVVYSIKNLFFLLLFKSLISQGHFQCFISISDSYCHSIEYVQKATAQEVYFFICTFCHIYMINQYLRAKGTCLFKIQKGKDRSWKQIRTNFNP